MGSITHISGNAENSFKKSQNYAKSILSFQTEKTDSIQTKDYFHFQKIILSNISLSIPLNEYISTRSWVFNLLFGDIPSYISVFRLGDLLMIGLPVELSAEYYPKLDLLATKKGLKLILTTFNGTYLGYATPATHFKIKHSETREMNWMGKYGGDYFEKIIEMIIEKQ